MTGSTKAARIAWANELVPLSQRLTYLDAFRGAAALLVALTAGFIGVSGTAGPSVLVATALYGVVTVAGGALWRVLRRRSLTLFGALIMTDGLYLAWVTYATGGATSPFRYLILIHLITVTLLASYRTGLKLALWHSMLLLATFHLSRAGALPVGKGADQLDVLHTAAFMAVFWVAAFVTSTFAAVNERELRRRKVDMEALAAMATELETTTDAGSLAAVLIANVKRHFGLHRVALLKAVDRRLSLWEFEGEPKGSEAPFAPLETSVLVDVLRLRGTALVRELDPASDAGLASLLPDAQNLVVAPLTAESGTVGVLVMEFGGRASRRIARRSLEMIERFASHGALALRNALLVEQMEELATVDALTGVANRRTFDDVIDEAIRRGSRSHKQVSLVMADIDHFKELNDARGHKVGDQALRAVSKTLASHVRSIDTVARYGGEEFAIVLPRCGPDEAAVRAEQLRKAIEQELKHLKLTVSFGVATYPTHAPNADRLIGASDKALYRSKANGRNTVSVFASQVDGLPSRTRETKRTVRRSGSTSPKRRASAREVDRDVA